ncbi:MAG: PadR family transcriptional regulator [Asgard group archaeon]|nr:PadR family transcriptional regulator [Asgard group archaeon]
MLKKVKTFQPEALIAKKEFRDYIESFESELLRGISTVAVLQIIKKYPTKGLYGYQILKELEEETKHLLIIEEGTLYPLLRKMEEDGVLTSMKKKYKGRTRKYYNLTSEGEKLLDHMSGFFSKLIEAMAPLMDYEIKLPEDTYMYCPNCANKILLDDSTKFCEVCGLYVEPYANQEVE